MTIWGENHPEMTIYMYRAKIVLLLKTPSTLDPRTRKVLGPEEIPGLKTLPSQPLTSAPVGPRLAHVDHDEAAVAQDLAP